MRASPHTTAETGGEAPPVFIQVWDVAVRVFHWGLVGGFVAAFLTAGAYGKLHTAIGYVVVSLVLFRIVWGFAGTRHARFTDFVRSPFAVLRYLRDLAAGRSPRHLGHNPAGGLMIVALLALFLVLGITGPLMLTSAFFGNALIETLHHSAAYAILGLLPLHLAGVVVASVIHRENLVAAMVTGRKRAEGPVDAAMAWREEVTDRMRAGNAMSIAALVALLVFVLYPAAQAQIEVMQRRAAALAKAQTPVGSVQPTAAMTEAGRAIATSGRTASVVALVGADAVDATRALTAGQVDAATEVAVVSEPDEPVLAASGIAQLPTEAPATVPVARATPGRIVKAHARPPARNPARRSLSQTRLLQTPPPPLKLVPRKPVPVGVAFVAPTRKPGAKARKADRLLILGESKTSRSNSGKGSRKSGKGSDNSGKGSRNSGKGSGS
jgi:cytochrome b